MTDEQEPNHADARPRSNAGLGITLRHKRFIYSCGSVYRVGIIHAGTEMWLHLRNAFGEDWVSQFPSESAAFEATFRYASVFVRWLDTEWVETDAPNVKLRGDQQREEL